MGKITTTEIVKTVAEISETQALVLDLLSSNLPDLTHRERVTLKREALEAAAKSEALVESCRAGESVILLPASSPE